MSLPTLIAISYQRPWTGKPSITQLINGTRLAYLLITRLYTIDPDQKAFALSGSRHHAKLDKVAQKINGLSEEKLDGETTGILDLVVPDDTRDGEWYELWDYKQPGSFKVAKCLGLVSHKAPDPTGATYKSSGHWGKAGSIKKVTVYETDPEAIDMWEWEYQLNGYRRKVEPLGFPISKMFTQVTVRDGGTQTAKQRGIQQNIYKIPVRRIDDDTIDTYFANKREALLTALETEKLPPPCNEAESWNGRRCKICDVNEFCLQKGVPRPVVT